MKLSSWIWIAALPAFAQNPGITPRPAASDYPAHSAARNLTIGAAIVPEDQVKKIFAAGLSKAGYVVLEVAIYPNKDQQPQVTPADFMLRMQSGSSTMRPAEPSVVATATVPYDKHHGAPPSLPGKVQVYTESTIGYESGPYHRGVYTSTGVGVGIGDPPIPPPPPSTSKSKDQVRDDLETLLSAKALPPGQTVQPIAGYLYFPKPAARHKSDSYELAWYGPDGTVKVILKPTN